MKFLILFVLLAYMSNIYGACENSPTGSSDQIVISLTPDDVSTDSKSFLFERKDGNWVLLNKTAWPAKVGRTGLAYGIGLHPAFKGRHKKEGDGKAPAGVFKLSSSFGHVANSSGSFPYKKVDTNSHCIDDVNHPEYNRILHDYDKERDARDRGLERISSENLLKVGAAYEYAVVVDHNNIAGGEVKLGAGSCIFIHIQKKDDQGLPKPTAGCTAFKRDQMKELVSWLDADKEPIMVQLTERDYKLHQAAWCLPKLKL